MKQEVRPVDIVALVERTVREMMGLPEKIDNSAVEREQVAARDSIKPPAPFQSANAATHVLIAELLEAADAGDTTAQIDAAGLTARLSPEDRDRLHAELAARLRNAAARE